MSVKDSWVGSSLTKKTIKEHITPHKIAVVILIQEYCNIKSQGRPRLSNPSYRILSQVKCILVKLKLT